MKDVATSETVRSAYAYPLLIRQLLLTPLAVNAEQEIVYRDVKRYNYRSLRHRIGRLASALSTIGVDSGETVAVMDWDSHRYLECYFAVPMMGATLMTVNVRLSPEQILYTLNHSGSSVLLINREFLPLIAQIKSRLKAIHRLVLIADDGHQPLPEGFSGEYETLLEEASPDYAFPDFDENTRATLFYTTGTTGAPKGVSFSHRQLVLHTLSVACALGTATHQSRIHRDDVYMPITPMFHVHAWGIPYVATLLGLKQVYPGRYAPQELLKWIKEEKVTFSHCVPTLLHMLLRQPEAREMDLRGWKVIIGGSALTGSLAQAALDRGIDVFGGYGMSETCPVLSVAQVKTSLQGDAAQALSLRIKAGLPIPLVDLRIVDEDMRDVPHDGAAAGEIVARAPWLTQDYFKDPEASEQLWEGGYLHTGDLGAIDTEGYVQVTDRMKDVIKSGGEWISSLELENILSMHPAVSEVAVIGVPDPKWGERPMALIVLKGEPLEKPDEREIQAHVMDFVAKGLISKYAVPGTVVFVDAIEKTSVGKIDKKRLRAQHAQP